MCKSMPDLHVTIEEIVAEGSVDSSIAATARPRRILRACPVVIRTMQTTTQPSTYRLGMSR